MRLITHLQHIDLRHMLIEHRQKHSLMHKLEQSRVWGFLKQARDCWGVSDILYLSLSISAHRLLPVNKVEVVKGGARLRDDIRSFCQITYTITSWHAVAGYITCANQVVMDLFPQDSPQVLKQITDISSIVSSSGFNTPRGNSSNAFVLALLEVEESFNNFCNHQSTETAPNGVV